MFKVIKKFEGKVSNLELTKHYLERANTRFQNEPTTIVDMFIVEKDGVQQLHIILSNATIIVVDKAKGKVVTLLNARVSQIKRYYIHPDRAPQWLKDRADMNKVNGLNV